MRFDNPDAIWFLVPLGVLTLGYVVQQLRRPRHAIRFGNLALLARATTRRRGWPRHLAAMAMLVGLAGLVGAAGEPVSVERSTEQRARVVLAIDVSPSMLAADVGPSRLVAAQDAARELIAGLPESFEFGIVQFSGEARLLVPPTTDRLAALQAIDNLEVGSETGIGEAVDASLGTLLRTTTDDDTPGAIVVMSDGKSTAGREVSEAAEEAAASGIAVSTIAFGTDRGEVELGGVVQPVPVDGSSLEALAGLTDGQHFTASDGDELADAYRQIIDPLEVEVETIVSRSGEWLMLGLLALLGAAAMSLVLEERLP